MEASPTFTPLELTEAHLRQASGIWVDYRDRSERCLNLDSQLLLKRTQAMDRVNYLLDSYLMELAADDGISTTG